MEGNHRLLPSVTTGHCFSFSIFSSVAIPSEVLHSRNKRGDKLDIPGPWPSGVLRSSKPNRIYYIPSPKHWSRSVDCGWTCTSPASEMSGHSFSTCIRDVEDLVMKDRIFDSGELWMCNCHSFMHGLVQTSADCGITRQSAANPLRRRR